MATRKLTEGEQEEILDYLAWRFSGGQEPNWDETAGWLAELEKCRLTPATPDLARPLDLGEPCGECGATDGWICSWCSPSG